MRNLRVGCSWSSGKDSCLALYKILQQKCKVEYLFNFVSAEYKRVSFHGAKAELVKLQSESIGIPLIQRETTKDNYESVFRRTLAELRKKDIHHVVRGDIHLQDLQDWVENVCSSEGIRVISPLWQIPTQQLIREFIEYGFKAVITCVQESKLCASFVGRTIDRKVILDLQKFSDVDLCGEKGEYHTFVYDGPIFRKRIEITETDKVFINGYWFLDIQKYELQNKE